MTREELMATKAESREKVEAGVQAYNAAFLDGNIDGMTTAEEETEKAIEAFNNSSKYIFFLDCLDADDPMQEACKKLQYDTISTKDVKVEGTALKNREVNDNLKFVDLLQLHQYAKEKGGRADGIGKDPKWNYMVEQFNCLLTARAAREIGVDPKNINDSYAMSAIAKEINLGKTPTSNTKLLEALNTIIGAMIGEEFKAVSHDVAFLVGGYTKKSRKALTLTAANHKTLRQTMAEICHKIMLSKAYALEYKQNTKK